MISDSRFAKVSHLKGHAYRFHQNQFYRISNGDTLERGDVILTVFQTAIVLTYHCQSKLPVKHLLPSDSLIVMQHESDYLTDDELEKLLHRIEALAPTANGQASGVNGVYLTTVGKLSYQSKMIKPLSLAQVNGIEQMALLSVKCSPFIQLQFSEMTLLSQLKMQKGDVSELLSISQPLKGVITQEHPNEFNYCCEKLENNVDAFYCTVKDSRQTILTCLFAMTVLEDSIMEIKLLDVTESAQSEDHLYDEEMLEMMTGADATEDYNDTEAILHQEKVMSDDILLNDNDLNFIEPEVEHVTYVLNTKKTSNDEIFSVIANFHDYDHIELRGLPNDVNDFSMFVRVSTRESELGINSVIEISNEGKMGDDVINQTLVLEQIDLTKGAEDQDEILELMIDSGLLVINLGEKAA